MSAPADRRGFLRGLAALPLLSLPAPAGEPHPDAAILALEPALTRLAHAMSTSIDAELAAEERAYGLAHARLPGGCDDPRWIEVLHAAMAEAGLPSYVGATCEAREAFRLAQDVIDPIRATTLDGLRVKARMSQHWEDLVYSIRDDLLAMGAPDARA